MKNEDGETLFQNAFQFEILSRYHDYEEGYYFMNSNSGELSDRMNSSMVETDNFETIERHGIYYTYSYLETGNYNLVQIANGNAAMQYGGQVESLTSNIDSNSCGLNAYNIINETAVSGSSLSIDMDNIFLILFDSIRAEILFQPIQKVAIIGSATEENWRVDTELPVVNTSNNGAEFLLEGTALTAGEFKFRFNCQWVINRHIDDTQSHGTPSNGYVIQSSLTENVNDGSLLLGNQGLNIMISAEQEGLYDVSLKWQGGSEFEYQLTRVGDIPTPDFDPTDFNWAIVGSTTEVGWPTDNDCGAEGQDLDLKYIGEVNGAFYWKIDAIKLEKDAFKFRANNCWDTNLGGDNSVITGASASNFEFDGSGNFSCLVSSVYTINLITDDKGKAI